MTLLTEATAREKARELLRGRPVGAGDGDTYVPREPSVAELAAALLAAQEAALERAAKLADTFTCGGCGMDGKSGAAIRAMKEKPNG